MRGFALTTPFEVPERATWQIAASADPRKRANIALEVGEGRWHP